MATISSTQTGNKSLDNLFNLINGVRAGWTLFAACKLELFDILHDFISGEATSDDLAKELGWDKDGLTRLLNTLVSMELLNAKLNNDGKVVYELTNTGSHLRRRSDESWYGVVFEAMEFPMDSIANAVKEGGFRDINHGFETDIKSDAHYHSKDPGTEGDSPGGHAHAAVDTPRYMMDTNKASEEELFQYYSEDAGFGKVHAPSIVKAFDLSNYKRAVDLGGGAGVLSIALAKEYPNMSVIMYDLPNVADMVKNRIFRNLPLNNVTAMGGDYHGKDLPPADLFLISMTVHCMTEDEIGKLFRKIHNALPQGGGLMVVDFCLNSTGRGPAPACIWDMFVIGHGGKVRTPDQYAELMDVNGFTNTRVCHTEETCAPDVILADKR